ncbi:WXG100 family type VII secretion target [Candidatus Epulonipiscium viviparus]|uniref:WXG100 family type VII secretion target n=1 Tax=Candidatus Epulonipiscium viviparus TaxID=420336 RepID=UPI00273810AB|nr:WXG100 family type VII secretion target [Candidatus Epulopiscium viviparus]
MAVIKVTADVLMSKELEATALVAEHGEAIEKIRQLVYRLSPMWQGDAQVAFLRIFEDMEPTFKEFRTTLDGYIELMHMTAEEFRRSDTEIGSSFV